MPTHLAYPVAMGAAVELKDHIYIVGGTSDWSTPIDTIQSATYTGGILGPFATLPLKLAQARCGAASQVIGNYLYIFGGSKTTREGFPLDTCNRFPINDDGTLGAGIELSNVHMKSGRVAFSVLYTGPYIYAIGGSTSPGQYTDSIERAPVNPDGTIGDFDNVPGVRLTEGKFTQALTWIGNKVYILGGETTMSSVSTVEVATVGDDGQLGTFAAYPNILSARRNRISLITLGNRLYLFGGFDGMGGFYTSVDTATVDGNSALGTFGISGTTTLTTGVESGTSLLTPDAAFYFGGHNFANGVTDVIQRATISP
jgi:hypothetical protein